MKLGIFKKKPKIKGFFDGVHDGLAIGWVFCPSKPDTILTIEIIQGDSIIARAPANLFREDLFKADIGDGKHAFSIMLPSTAFEAADYQARECSTGKILPISIPTANLAINGFLPIEDSKKILEEILIEQAIPLGIRNKHLSKFQKTCALQNAGSYSQAQSAFKDMLIDIGNNALLYCKLAEIAEQTGRWQEALSFYQTALEFDSQFYWCYTGLGRMYQQLGQLHNARDAFSKAHVLDPTDTLTLDKLSALRILVNKSEQNLPYEDLIEQAEAARSLLETLISTDQSRLKRTRP